VLYPVELRDHAHRKQSPRPGGGAAPVLPADLTCPVARPGFLLEERGDRQVRVSEAKDECQMDFILLTPGAVEGGIAVCVALLLGLATYVALT
jgi:hypothetical protein